MEQIIPILIAAVIFGFQAYQNYQKEQEKARKRNPGQRPPQLPGEEERPAFDVPQTAVPLPAPATEYMPERYQEYAGFIDEDQLSRQAKQRSRRNQQDLLKRIEVTDQEEDERNSDEGAFDLREAVIYATILERPYK